MRVSTVFGSVAERRFEFPDGSIYEVAVPGASTNGARSEIQVTLPPVPLTPPAHIHPKQDETYTVTEGTLDALVGQQWQSLTGGQSVTIPAGTVHTFRNRSGENVSFRSVHAPALRFEQYLERAYWLFAMNRIRGTRSLSSLLYLSLLLDTHRDDQVLAGSGRRLAVRTLAGMARLMRFRLDREPRPS